MHAEPAVGGGERDEYSSKEGPKVPKFKACTSRTSWRPPRTLDVLIMTFTCDYTHYHK